MTNVFAGSRLQMHWPGLPQVDSRLDAIINMQGPACLLTI